MAALWFWLALLAVPALASAYSWRVRRDVRRSFPEDIPRRARRDAIHQRRSETAPLQQLSVQAEHTGDHPRSVGQGGFGGYGGYGGGGADGMGYGDGFRVGG